MLGACPSNCMGRAHGACEVIEARGGGDAGHRRRRATTSSPAIPMCPAGSGGVPASAALPLLDKGPPCRRRGAWHLPTRRSERDPCHYSDRLLERSVGPLDGAPHVRDRAVVVTEPFLRLLEVPADDVHERVEAHLRIRVEGIQIVHRHHPRLAVPLVTSGTAR